MTESELRQEMLESKLGLAVACRDLEALSGKEEQTKRGCTVNSQSAVVASA